MGTYQLKPGIDTPAISDVSQEAEDDNVHVGIRACLQEAQLPGNPFLTEVDSNIP